MVHLIPLSTPLSRLNSMTEASAIPQHPIQTRKTLPAQRQKKPHRGVKVDAAAKEKKDLGMFYLCNPSINPIRPIASKKISTALFLSTLAKPAEPLLQPSSTDTYDVNSKIVTLLHTSNSVTASHDMSSNNSIIVKGAREKKCILTAYQEKNWLKVS